MVKTGNIVVIYTWQLNVRWKIVTLASGKICFYLPADSHVHVVKSNGQLLAQFTINVELNKEQPHAICKYVVVVGGRGVVSV